MSEWILRVSDRCSCDYANVADGREVVTRMDPSCPDHGQSKVRSETAEEFLTGYAQRSGRTREELLQDRVVATCACDYDACTGWQLIAEKHLLPWSGDVVAIRG
ncbi:hypothetical protein HOU49_gp33 [Arthrobacter phage Eileen]|uniref:Uncharacterized protein n=1 Tax=Arthrobacter phage Eileen TaxID=2419956 RepID=A0A3G2KFQ2_9CAUD|nr:hypothetical protein HOU49_gp33 [Arthrobacter phage Eileen]AYN57822.1 hypothetical protein PBI_EILEEN_33 [Arthrobacter phage Eileen]